MKTLLFSCFLLLVGCSEEKKQMQKPITDNLEKKAFVFTTTENVVVNTMTEEEIAKAKAETKRKALENRLSFYSKAFTDIVFYEDENNCILLSSPDTKGKGQGMIGELGGFLPTFYDFHYAIDMENINEEEISCEMDKYDANFTIEVKGKRLYYRTKGNLGILRGEKDPKTYSIFLERVQKINTGKDVYGNPKYRVTISE